MKWHPFLNAATAILYIGAVTLFMHFIESVRHDTPDTLFDGMGVISLLVLSVAVMGFLFFYHPVQLLIERKKREAVAYFLKTLGLFSLGTIILLTLTSIQ